MSEIIASKVLPPEVVITGADSHLYRIGISMQNTGPIKRKWYFKPIIVFMVLFQQLVRSLAFISLPGQSIWFYACLGDVGYFMGLRLHTNIVISVIMIQMLACQMIFFSNYMKRIIPKDLRVFQVMSGLISPQSIGLNDTKIIHKLLKVFNRFLSLGYKCVQFISILCFTVIFFTYYFKLSGLY